ncbi:MAG TPA: ATP-binding protein [Phenylobacterium sp.]
MNADEPCERDFPTAAPDRAAGAETPIRVRERILVLVGADRTAATLVRVGQQLSAAMMNAPWTVAHVARPDANPVSAAAAQALQDAFKLAEQLGGSTVTLASDDLRACALDYARRSDMTQIVVGRGRGPRFPYRHRLDRTLLDASPAATVHIVAGDPAAPRPARGPSRRSPRGLSWRGHLGALGVVGAAAGVAWIVDRYVESADLAMVFMLSVLVSGLAFGLWPAVTAAAAAAFIYNFFFLLPRLTIYIAHPADVLTFAVFFAVAMTTGWLTGRVRDQARIAARSASAIAAVLSATRRLSASATASEAAKALAEQLAAATNGRAVVLTPRGHDLEISAADPPLEVLAADDMAAALLAWDMGEPAGSGTDAPPAARWTFRPLQGVKLRAGVVGVAPSAVATEDGERFVAALLDQGAVALERAELAADAADAEALRRTDTLRSALLNSVSHDLRTPLSTVLGSATTLIDYGKSLSPKVRDDLLLSIREEAERLNRYVGDLLDMTRLEGGALVTRREWTDARDVLRAAVARVKRRLDGRRIKWDFPDQVTMVMADASLLEQALVNILENAVAYSPDGTTIEVAAYEDRRNVVISIEDQGRGIPTVELERVFEKFRRMDEATDRGKGTGLGLAISKGFVEAMGGRIAAASPIDDGRGTRILISLPKERATPEGWL